MNRVEYLQWDSTFFSRNIGRIDSDNLNTADLKALLEAARNAGFTLLYVFTNSGKTVDNGLLVDFGGQRVDTKLTYAQQLPTTATPLTDKQIHEFTVNDDVTSLYNLAYQSGEHSRFKVDSRFGEDEFRRFYREWINKSLAGKMADHVFVYKLDYKIVGFITVRKEGEHATIGLIATDRAMRGQGIGKALLNHTKNFLAAPYTLNVVTQRDNTLACAFYERNGFSLKEESGVYHFWL
jgi:dTDP-4-amino-4,6-dideoxy-D-galactose acyltransferase